jgi:hypothetical protein
VVSALRTVAISILVPPSNSLGGEPAQVGGGNPDLPAAGQITLPTHDHLVTDGAVGAGHESPAVLPSTGTSVAMPHVVMAARSGALGYARACTRAVDPCGLPPQVRVR